MDIRVISLGGSLINPGNINSEFLKSFKYLIKKQIQRGKRFAIVCGGGRLARVYQESARLISNTGQDELDWLAICCTKLNAYLVKTIFGDLTHPKIIENPTEKIDFREKILIGSGWHPGFSTDYCAVCLAKNLGARKIINLTNIDYVYDKDPDKNKDAKPIRQISWSKFRKILPKDWIPGLNAPFDPVAAKEAEKLKFEVAIMNGEKLNNLENYLDDKNFIGTIIK